MTLKATAIGGPHHGVTLTAGASWSGIVLQDPKGRYVWNKTKKVWEWNEKHHRTHRRRCDW